MSEHVPGTIRDQLAARGWAVIELGERTLARLLQPWLLIDGLIGAAPQLTEVQPIRPVAHARSFAASREPAPLHTDSQLWRGRPAELQLTACLHPAAQGGASVLLDGFALVERARAEHPALYAALLERPRRMPFVFGDVFGPTAARRAGRHVVTATPRPVPGDAVATALAEWMRATPPQRVQLRAGEALLLDNQRMLHGRDGFDDPGRELLRVLAWLEHPLHAAPSWADDADAQRHRLAARLADAPLEVQRAFGLDESRPSAAEAAVFAMLSGAPPGALARRLGLAEPELYRLRDAGVGAVAPADPQACARALAALTEPR